MVGAHLQRGGERRLGDVDRDDLRRSAHPRGGDGERADRASPGDQHALSQQRPRPGHGVERNRQRLGKGRLRGGDRRRQHAGLALADGEALAERALDMREAHCAAEEAHVQALVLQAVLAIAAGAAGDAGIDGDELADLDRADARADRADRAGNLVAEDHRLLQAHGAEAAMEEIVQVRPAYAAGGDVDTDVALAEIFVRDLLEAEILRRVEDAGFHG